MTTIAQAAQALSAALDAVDGVRVYTDLGAVLDPPAACVGPPRLEWGGMGPEPTEATFVVALVVRADDRTLPRLWELIPPVAAALDAVNDAVVRRAEPGTWPSGGGVELPGYLFEIEVAL